MSKLYAIVCRDAPDSAAARAEHRAAHFARVEDIIDQLAIAGPLKDEAGNIVGSLVVVHADSKDGARAILEGDPYFGAGVWADCQIHEFIAAAGTWVGGKNW